ncbi:hypothetical protein B0E47_12235 [Rhodanobacter sp. B05]|jgi:hypothetical protein|nr:hypothetical protein B0E47_12235 [Rhodanobacter sp. B05]
MENVMRRLIIILMVAAWCVAGHATSNLSSSFGVSVTIVRRIVTPTPAGAVSAICYGTPCIQPRVTVEPADPETGISIVKIIY